MSSVISSAGAESFPILYLNMSGEMIYIIEQRLSAQGVESCKANKVLHDIITAVFNTRLISEVFKPHHNAITFGVLRSIFEKLAHSSIMRLNEQSMNKLFDLMIMVVKYQLLSCSKPSDLLLITDNHLLSILHMITNISGGGGGAGGNNDANNVSSNNDSPVPAQAKTIENLVTTVRNQFLYHYQNRYDLYALQMIRYSLLNFFKDIHTRVSIFIRNGVQNCDGRFVIATSRVVVECDCQIPGVIRYFHQPGNQLKCLDHFDTDTQFVVVNERTTLGLNIYNSEPKNGSMINDHSINNTTETDVKCTNDDVNSVKPTGEQQQQKQRKSITTTTDVDLLSILIHGKSSSTKSSANTIDGDKESNNDNDENDNSHKSPPSATADDQMIFQFDFLESNNNNNIDEHRKQPKILKLDVNVSDENYEKNEMDKMDHRDKQTVIRPYHQHLIEIINDLNSLDIVGNGGTTVAQCVNNTATANGLNENDQKDSVNATTKEKNANANVNVNNDVEDDDDLDYLQLMDS